jgi:hypothetical protein
MNSNIQILYAVNKHLELLLNNKSTFQSLFKKITKHGDVLLFGGAIRDILADKTPRDYDFVVTFRSSFLEEILASFEFRKNRFGGYKLVLDGIKIDIWSIDDTWAFRNKLISSSPENLTKTVFLNIDSIAVNLCRGNVYAKRYREAIEKNLLDIVLEKNPFPELCVLRALIFKCTNNINISKNLREFIVKWKHGVNEPIDILYNIQRSRNGEKSLSWHQIIEELSEF